MFDTSALATLTKAVGDRVTGETDLPILMKAMNKLGTRLFNFYWHSEDMEDKFGKNDLPEFEDGLRNAFMTLGKVVLFVKQKSVVPVFQGLGDVDMDDVGQN